MIGGLLAVLAIVIIGGRATDGLRRAEAEDILSRLPKPDAVAYYDVIRRRVRRVVLMRALALIALLWIMMVLRHRLGLRANDAQPRSAQHERGELERIDRREAQIFDSRLFIGRDFWLVTVAVKDAVFLRG